MYRRRMLSLLSLLAGGWAGASAVTASATGQSAPDAPSAVAHRFSAAGATLTEPFRLESGITTVDLQHDGESTVRVELIPSRNTAAGRLLVTADGAIEAGRAIVTTGDSFVFAVTADGEWSLRCRQPAVETVDADPPPRTASGVGPDYIGPVLLYRTTELIARHQGDGSFGVQAHTPSESQQVITDSGTVEEWLSTEIAGPTWFDIDADGDWQLDVF